MGGKYGPIAFKFYLRYSGTQTVKQIRSRKKSDAASQIDAPGAFLNDFCKWMEGDGRLARTSGSVARGDVHFGHLER